MTKFAFQLENEVKNDALTIEDINDITIGDLAKGYVDNSENVSGGVFALDGKLEVRPKFQRAYVVDGNKNWQSKLIHSVLNGRPIGTIYFGLTTNKLFKYLNIDGQQRMMTLCGFVNGDLTLPMRDGDKIIEVNFEHLPSYYQERILNYTPCIKVCKGNEEALLEWFVTINQPISELTKQELRNAAYNGSFVEAIKRHFAKTKKSERLTNDNGIFMDENSVYYYNHFMNGCEPCRQDIVEVVLDWVSMKYYDTEIDTDTRIESYMLTHRNDDNANEAVENYKNVVDWVNDIFLHDYVIEDERAYQSFRHQNWGKLYLLYKDFTKSMTDDEKRHITERCRFFIEMGASFYQKSTGIYEWVLRGEKDEEVNKYLHLRNFNAEDKKYVYKLQNGLDPITKKAYKIEDMECHHILPWKNGGRTDRDNLMLLSKETHQNIDILGYTPAQLKELRDNINK